MFKRILHRINQLWFVLFVKITEEDKVFVRKYLTIPEMALFELLQNDIKKHSIVIAGRLLEISHADPGLDVRALVRSGLLHDVGKALAHLSVISRVVFVLLRRFINPFYNWLAYMGRGRNALGFLRKVYVHKKHSAIAARLLNAAGTEKKVVDLVRAHDDEPKEEDSKELILLRKVDEGDL